MQAALRSALILTSLLSVPMLPGCALYETEFASAVPADLTSADAARIADAMTDLTTRRVPASSGAILVRAPAGDAVLTPTLVHDLKTAGFTVADSGPHRITFQVNALGNDMLVRMDLDGVRAARLFTRTARGLSAAGAFTVREPQVAAR